MDNAKKLLQLAEEHLEKDEKIEHTILGQYEIKILGNENTRKGVFIATSKRLVFFAKKLTGFDLEVFPYANISSIEMSKGFTGYSISFFSSGNKAKMKYIKEKNEGSVQRFIEYVKNNLEKKESTPESTNTAIGTTEQIKKLAELKEQGILTDEEFQSKKTELLSKI